MTSDTCDYVGFHTIVITEFIEDYEEIIKQILKDCWSLYIANAIILTPSKHNDIICLFTYFSYTPNHCEGVKPVVYDYLKNVSFFCSADIFPDKLQNFHKCPLRVSLYEFVPFILLDKLSNETHHIDGIEGTITLCCRND